ncbi:MAG: hypothetical protein AAF557_27540 [Pseudomonadota bacterium]
MRIFLSAICLWAFTFNAGAQEMTPNEAETAYLTAKSELDLTDYRDPYYEPMQVLDDEEHGSNDPARLIFFDEILKADGRDEASDRDILAPWLIRYIWVTDYPNYTQGAVRLLFSLSLDDALIAVIAKDILQNHPHGLARAAVIEPTDAYHDWNEDAEIGKIVQNLALTDPHPEVRRNAIEFLYSASFPVDQLIQALRSDPATEIRALWASVFARQLPDAERSEAPLREALFAPQNASVAPALMLTYLSSGPVKSDLQRLAHGLNFIAAHPDHPQMIKLLDAFGWQTDEVAVPVLLAGTPFDDGEALRAWLRAKFADAGAPMIERSFALNTLAQNDSEKIDVQAIADFMLNPQHTNDTLAPLFGLSLGSRALRRMFVVWPASMVSQADTQTDLIERLLSHFSALDAGGTPRAHAIVQDGFLRELQRILRLIRSDEEKAWLVDRLLRYAAAAPEDLTYGVADLLGNRELVSDDALLAYVRSKSDGFSSSLAGTFVDRLRPGAWEDPELQAGDLTLAIKIIEHSEKAHPGDPDAAYQAIYDMVYQLPTKDELPQDLQDLPAFEAKLRDMQTRAVREDGYWAIERWFGEN